MSSTSSMSPLSVILLVDYDNHEYQGIVKEVQNILDETYFNSSPEVTVSIRSSKVPAERLISNDSNNNNNILFVVIGIETATTIYLDTYSIHPVLKVPNSLSSTNDIALYIAKYCSITSNKSITVAVMMTMQSKKQEQLVNDANIKTIGYMKYITSCYDNNKQITGDNVTYTSTTVERKRGKVRDRFIFTNNNTSNKLALLTTDRQSGFDRQLAIIPYKGSVLNLCSQYWFNITKDIIPNHLIDIPHPSISIVKKCIPFPIEFVVRSYMTGSTSTSIWKNYQNGVRNYCGHILPDGMTKNQKLSENLLTPTTKEEEHDRPISLDDIVKENWMTKDDLDICANAALAIFKRGQDIAIQHGLILVDTKYEFGKCIETNEILLIDEVHTPDSSRYWLASSATERINAGKEPENIDKEFLRLWFNEHCDPYNDKTIPDAPRDLVIELSRRYIQLYEMITWNNFNFNDQGDEDAISAAIAKYA